MDPQLSQRLGAVAFAELARRGATFDRSACLDDDALRAHLTARGYPAHDAVLAFERAWGGLQLEGLTIGAGACAESGERGGPPGVTEELVPVVISDGDNYYFVAADGVVWAQDGIEDPEATQMTTTGDRLVAMLALYGLAWDRRMADLALDLDGVRGGGIAAALGLPAISEVSDALIHVWGDADALVIERAQGTLVAVSSAALLARVPRPAG